MTRPRQTTKKRPKRDPNKLAPVQVAQLCGCTYLAAYNMMSRKVFGEPEVTEHGSQNRMTVPRAAVQAWLKQRRAAMDVGATL
jgi:hypothetical protein